MTTTRRIADERSQQAALDAHVAAENLRDVDAIMATVAPDAVFVFNGVRYDTPATIRALHESIGFGENPALSDIEQIMHRRIFTGDSIVVEGTMRARHTGQLGSTPASGKMVTFPYCAVYQFDDQGKCYSERSYLIVTL